MNILNTAYASSYFKLETTKGNTITGRTMEAPGLIYGKMAIVPRGYAFEIIGKKS